MRHWGRDEEGEGGGEEGGEEDWENGVENHGFGEGCVRVNWRFRNGNEYLGYL